MDMQTHRASVADHMESDSGEQAACGSEAHDLAAADAQAGGGERRGGRWTAAAVETPAAARTPGTARPRWPRAAPRAVGGASVADAGTASGGGEKVATTCFLVLRGRAHQRGCWRGLRLGDDSGLDVDACGTEVGKSRSRRKRAQIRKSASDLRPSWRSRPARNRCRRPRRRHGRVEDGPRGGWRRRGPLETAMRAVGEAVATAAAKILAGPAAGDGGGDVWRRRRRTLRAARWRRRRRGRRRPRLQQAGRFGDGGGDR